MPHMRKPPDAVRAGTLVFATRCEAQDGCPDPARLVSIRSSDEGARICLAHAVRLLGPRRVAAILAGRAAGEGFIPYPPVAPIVETGRRKKDPDEEDPA